MSEGSLVSLYVLAGGEIGMFPCSGCRTVSGQKAWLWLLGSRFPVLWAERETCQRRKPQAPEVVQGGEDRPQALGVMSGTAAVPLGQTLLLPAGSSRGV